MVFQILQPKNAKEFQKMTQGREKVMVSGFNEEINRMAVESKKVSMLVSPERGFGNDRMDARNSGLNDVLCKLAAKNGVAIWVDIDELLQLHQDARIRRLGKILQNVRLCRKYHVKMVLVDGKGRNEKDLKSFGICMGMQPGVEVVKC